MKLIVTVDEGAPGSLETAQTLWDAFDARRVADGEYLVDADPGVISGFAEAHRDVVLDVAEDKVKTK